MTYANQLTILRMAFVPCFVLMVVYNRLGAALILFFVAGLTDLLDGLIARTFSQRTQLGTVLDPMADKLLLVSAFVTLSLESLALTVRIPLWLTISAIGRDLLLVLSVLMINLFVGRRIFTPSLLGKVTTVAQLMTVLLVLVSNLRADPLPGLIVAFQLTLALTIASGVHYMFRGMKLLGQEERAAE